MLPLDDPIWNALTTDHAEFARTHGAARRYPRDVSPFVALEDNSPAAFADLRALVEPGERVALVTDRAVDVPTDWNVAIARQIDQMVCDAPPVDVATGRGGTVLLAPAHTILELAAEDVPEMLTLTETTKPGPFLPGTVRMGRYIGVREDNRLVAMAGERLRPSGATEISAVCTDPAYTGRGYAGSLMTALMRDAVAAGRTPMLHVKTENGAKRLYEKLGFSVRRAIHFTVITR